MAPPPSSGNTVPAGPTVVLGSGSRYRRDLLSRVLPSFEVMAPGIDEAARPGEAPRELAVRLAGLKASWVAERRPGAVVIGSDQVAECSGRILGKPGTASRAVEQLRGCAGQWVILHTAVCVQGPGGPPPLACIDRTALRFKTLSESEISAYVRRDQPLDCAGSFKFESLGAALFSEVDTRDPTAIQGLPLLWLTDALARFGIPVL